MPPTTKSRLSTLTDPRDPALDKWLRSLDRRVELVVRYAMRYHFAAVRGDRGFSARIDELTAQLRPDETQLAMILADAREVSKHVEELIGAPRPETKAAELVRQRRGGKSRPRTTPST
jgi:hypothetical protein